MHTQTTERSVNTLEATPWQPSPFPLPFRSGISTPEELKLRAGRRQYATGNGAEWIGDWWLRDKDLGSCYKSRWQIATALNQSRSIKKIPPPFLRQWTRMRKPSWSTRPVWGCAFGSSCSSVWARCWPWWWCCAVASGSEFHAPSRTSRRTTGGSGWPGSFASGSTAWTTPTLTRWICWKVWQTYLREKDYGVTKVGFAFQRSIGYGNSVWWRRRSPVGTKWSWILSTTTVMCLKVLEYFE